MKKSIIIVFLLTVSAIFTWAETTTLDNAFKVMNANFGKYPYAQFLQRDKTEDNRAPKVDLSRGTYEGGEFYRVSIIKGGYRYDVVINFTEKKEPYSMLVRDVKLQTRALLADVLPDSEK